MFANDIYLKSTTTGTPRKFVLTNATGSDKIRTFNGSIPGLPETLAIKHQVRGKAGNQSQAHVVQLQQVIVDSFGVKKTAKIGLTIEHSEGAFTTTNLETMLEEFLSFFMTPQASQSVVGSVVAGSVDTATVIDLALGAS